MQMFDPTKIDTTTPAAMVRPADELATLAKEVNAEHAAWIAAAKTCLEKANRIGQLLIKAKASCKHGQWTGWVKANLKFSDHQARKYMRIAREWPEISKRTCGTDLGINAALQLLVEEAPQEQPDGGADLVGADLDAERTAHQAVPQELRGDEWQAEDVRFNGPTSDHGTMPVESVQAPGQLCERCQRVGWRSSCQTCKELNRKGRAGTRHRPTRSEVPSEEEPKDCFGTPVPENCRDVLFDPWLQKFYDNLARWSEEIRMSFYMDGMEKRRKRLPMLRADDLQGGLHILIDTLDKMIDHLKDERPAAVCPACQGNSCTHCLSTGLVSRKTHGQIKEQMGKGLIAVEPEDDPRNVTG
jgi:hypothetical protein